MKWRTFGARDNSRLLRERRELAQMRNSAHLAQIPGFSFPDERLPKAKSRGSSKKETREIGLRQRQKDLVEQEAVAWREVEKAKAQSDPFKQAFDGAHRVCVAFWQQRQAGAVIHADDWFGAYDARMYAGHEWHPHKKRLEEAERWLKEIKRELKIVNEELGK